MADKYISLTIDDGPSARTGRVLDVLGELGIKAAFFLIGGNVRSRPDDARRIVAEGHEVGSHSDDHSRLGVEGAAGGAVNREKVRENLAAASAAIKEIAGNPPFFFRAPYLDYGPELDLAARDMGMAFVGTDLVCSDWNPAISTRQIVDDIVNSAKDGGIIILHEHSEGDLDRTIRAIPEISRELRGKGYEFLGLRALAELKGIRLEAGVRYNFF